MTEWKDAIANVDVGSSYEQKVGENKTFLLEEPHLLAWRERRPYILQASVAANIV